MIKWLYSKPVEYVSVLLFYTKRYSLYFLLLLLVFFFKFPVSFEILADPAKRRTANHPCPVCGKHYVNEGSLRKHLACHPETSQLTTSLRMWPCSVCQAVFTHESGLCKLCSHVSLIWYGRCMPKMVSEKKTILNVRLYVYIQNEE